MNRLRNRRDLYQPSAVQAAVEHPGPRAAPRTGKRIFSVPQSPTPRSGKEDSSAPVTEADRVLVLEKEVKNLYAHDLEPVSPELYASFGGEKGLLPRL